MRRRSIPLVKTERSDRESIVAMSRSVMILMCSLPHIVADFEVKDTQFRLLLGTIAAASRGKRPRVGGARLLLIVALNMKHMK